MEKVADILVTVGKACGESAEKVGARAQRVSGRVWAVVSVEMAELYPSRWRGVT